MPDYHRRSLSAREFRTAVARFRELYPDSVITSTHRTELHNAAVGGSPESKHLLSPLEPIACDLVWPGGDPALAVRTAMIHDAKVLGVWPRYHDGHMHLQGLKPGPVPEGWSPV